MRRTMSRVLFAAVQGMRAYEVPLDRRQAEFSAYVLKQEHLGAVIRNFARMQARSCNFYPRACSLIIA
jgi:hypothetical protein